jgi:hypothetical protein
MLSRRSMSYYSYDTSERRQARAWAQARSQRVQRFWLWFWCAVGAAFLLVSLALAGNVATALIAGFMPHAHG